MPRDSQPAHEAEPTIPKKESEATKPTLKTKETKTPKFEIPTELDLKTQNGRKGIIEFCNEHRKELEDELSEFLKSKNDFIKALNEAKIEKAEAYADLRALTAQTSGLGFHESFADMIQKDVDKTKQCAKLISEYEGKIKKCDEIIEEINGDINRNNETEVTHREFFIAWEKKFGPTPE